TGTGWPSRRNTRSRTSSRNGPNWLFEGFSKSWLQTIHFVARPRGYHAESRGLPNRPNRDFSTRDAIGCELQAPAQACESAAPGGTPTLQQRSNGYQSAFKPTSKDAATTGQLGAGQ